MHELTGKIQGFSYSLSGNVQVLFELNDRKTALRMAEELREEDLLTLKIGKFKKKRSLDANAYCWVLMGKIAEKTNIPKDEVYRNAIRGIGGNYDVVCIQDKAVDSLCSAWARNGVGWQTDTMPSKLDGCTNVMLYYGSSTYDTEQMSRLIDNIVQDCKALGIETKSGAEIDSLLGSWGGSK